MCLQRENKYQVQSGFELAIPYIHAAYEKYKSLALYLAPYRVDLLIPALAGLVLVFFGGMFMTLIAVKPP